MGLSLIRCATISALLLLAAGCSSDGPSAGSNPTPDPDVDPTQKRTRYSFNNQCFALKAKSNNKYVAVSGAGYAASANEITGAEGFYLKPSVLGEYLVYNRDGKLVTAAAAPTNPGGAPCTPGQTVCNQSLDDASDSSIFVVKAVDDATNYPAAPVFDIEPTAAQVNTYRSFVDPNTLATLFTLASKPDGRRLGTSGEGALGLAAAAAGTAQQFSFELLTAASCAVFPEAQNNAVGNTFKGTTADGRVIGMADTHVHVVSTTFLGGAKWGAPFHKFGVKHALGDCTPRHGANGERDAVIGVFKQDTDGHATAGWPKFTEWPAREALTHEAIYWKWLERAWLAGLRILVNDVVENETLCELQRNASGEPSENCNEMQNARNQVGTLYAMQDYIDAQYGGRGKGWFRIVWTPAEARSVVSNGKLAVVIGIEISNLFNCQLTYKPTRQQEPYQETGTGTGENSYKCTTTETGAPNEIKTQLDNAVALGVRQLITIHEFDNAFGGNGIFLDLLNLGNRENTGGNPTPGFPPNDPFAGNPANASPSGEFWTTYDCPTEDALRVGDPSNGYLWENAAGEDLSSISPPGCVPAGQNGRNGGTTPCYPAEVNQCNARWMTPIGLYLYKKLMENGIIFDFDHMTLDMKTQALELAEAQSPPYPFVSTHGTFGGTTLEQARRVIKNGGHLYNSVSSTEGLLGDMQETRTTWSEAASPYRTSLFGYGFGTDTNGLSDEAGPRSATRIAADGPLAYGYILFKGPVFDQIPDLAALDDDGNPATPYLGVTFNQPMEGEPPDNGKAWHADVDGSAHYGMLSDMVEEIRLDAVASAQRDAVPLSARTEHMRDLFNSAEVYIQTWERTLAAQAGILGNNNGGETKVPDGILRRAPLPGNPDPPE